MQYLLTELKPQGVSSLWEVEGMGGGEGRTGEPWNVRTTLAGISLWTDLAQSPQPVAAAQLVWMQTYPEGSFGIPRSQVWRPVEGTGFPTISAEVERARGLSMSCSHADARGSAPPHLCVLCSVPGQP